MQNQLILKEKVVLITGAARGLGRHFALTLAKAGAFVVVTSLKDELQQLNSLVDEIVKQGGNAFALDLDVREYSTFDQKISIILKQTKRIDILINNAGVSYYTEFFDITEKDWDSHIDANLKGAFFLAQAVSKQMIKQNIAGSIINIGSIAGWQAKKYALPFCISKAGLHHITKIMAYELVEYNIRVNMLALGLFPTELTQEYITSEAGKIFIEQIPLKRPGKYDEINGALLLLASEASSYMTGTIIDIDGGFSIDIFLKENFDNKSNAFFKSELHK